jgi:putative flippase GtrA
VLDARLVRYLLISAFTFALDLALLTALRGGLGWPLPVAVTGAYAVALTTNFLLNRVLTFRSRARLGPESVRYGAAVAVNFGVVLLGVTTGLSAAGVPYQAARVAAGAAEGVFMYVAMRWFVFSPARSTASPPAAPASRPPSGRAAR